MTVLINELLEISQNHELELPALRIQYKDFAAWQNQLFRSGAIKKQEEYWLQIFSGEIPLLNMPTDYPRPTIQSFEGGLYTFELGETAVREIHRLTAQTVADVVYISASGL